MDVAYSIQRILEVTERSDCLVISMDDAVDNNCGETIYHNSCRAQIVEYWGLIQEHGSVEGNDLAIDRDHVTDFGK